MQNVGRSKALRTAVLLCLAFFAYRSLLHWLLPSDAIDVDAAPRLPPVAAASTPLTPAASLTNERESGRQAGAGLLQDLGKFAAAPTADSGSHGPYHALVGNVSQYLPAMPGTPLSVLDLGTTPETLALARALPADSTVVTSPLEVDSAVAALHAPANLVALSALTPHKLYSLGATLNFFDFLLLLRLPDILHQFPTIQVHQLLGNLLPLAKATFLLLPCGLDDAVVHAAVAGALRANYTVGVKAMGYTVTRLPLEARLTHASGSCRQPVLRVTVQSMLRGTRQTWCVHELHSFLGKLLSDHKLKYDFRYRAPAVYQIGLLGKEGFKVAKDLSSEWKSSVKLKDLLGWGLGVWQRGLFLAQQLGVPQYPDAGAHNWVVCCGARAERIDSTDRAGARSFPKAKYLNLLKNEVCLYNSSVAVLFDCAPCKACWEHRFAWVKTKTPPPECQQCGQRFRESLREKSVGDFFRDRVVEDCNVDPDTQYVLPGEHKCYNY
eukprot:EG_transcript_8377